MVGKNDHSANAAMKVSSMNDQMQKILQIEAEYYNIIFEAYPDLLDMYDQGGISIHETIQKYIQNKPIIIIPNHSDNIVYKKTKFLKEVHNFWLKNIDAIQDCFTSQNKYSIGVFGGADHSAYDYSEEISRNSLFFDILVFDDPFFLLDDETEKEQVYTPNKIAFFESILLVYSIKKFVFQENGEPFVLIVPFHLLGDNCKALFFSEADVKSKEYLSNTFGLTYNDYISDIGTIKEWSLERIQAQLYSDGLFYSVGEAMNYSQNMISDKSKREFENLCFELWGGFNRDFLRCILFLEALRGIAHTSYYTYKIHYNIAQQLRGCPINNRNEWTPMKMEFGSATFRASEDYLFTCAVHRNDQLYQLVSLTESELCQLRTRKTCAEFRNFFHQATNSLILSYSDTEEIANEVFAKVDEMLITHEQLSALSKKSASKRAIFGLAKIGLSLIPFLSYGVAAFDTLVTSKDYLSTMADLHGGA